MRGLSYISVPVYAGGSGAVKERPANGYYAAGVDVGYTAPAKWWNWLLNKATVLIGLVYLDTHALYSELRNLLTEAGMSPDEMDMHQVSKAIDAVCYGRDEAYDDETISEEIGGVTVLHPKNRPYAASNTVYYPDTELL